MVDPIRAIQGLPPLYWRGLEHLSYTDASFSFRHRQNPQQYSYIDAASHDNTGRDSFELPMELYFLNTIRDDAFPDHYNDWMKKLLDGKSGELEHPLAGTFDAVVLGGNVRLTGQSTAGVVVQVTFSETILDPEKAQEQQTLVLSLEAIAIEAQKQTIALGIELPSQAQVVTLLDLAKIVESAIFSAQLEAMGLINQAKGIVDDMIKLTTAIPDHNRYAAQDSLIALWAAFDDLGDKVGENLARATQGFLTINPTTLDAFARERGMTLEEAVSLNPGAAASPEVAAGMMLKYYV